MSAKSPKPEAPKVPETFSCPLTGDERKSGRPAECDHFWRCIRDALDLRRPGHDVSKVPTDQADGPAGGDV